MPHAMKSILFRRALPLLLAAVLLPDPVSAQSFEGTFADGGMVLTLKQARGRYNGTLVYDGQFYAVDAEEVGGELRGSFATDRGSFDFRAFFTGEVLSFESNTITYPLGRVGQPAGGTPAPVPETAPAAEPGAADPAPEAGAEIEEVAISELGGGPAAEAAPPAPRTADRQAETPDGVGDAELVGVWTREAIDADAGTSLPGVTTLELAADGSYAARGGPKPDAGRWRTEGSTLLLRPAADGGWQAYCRYRRVASTLLCTFEDGSRQLWFRR